MICSRTSLSMVSSLIIFLCSSFWLFVLSVFLCLCVLVCICNDLLQNLSLHEQQIIIVLCNCVFVLCILLFVFLFLSLLVRRHLPQIRIIGQIFLHPLTESFRWIQTGRVSKRSVGGRSWTTTRRTRQSKNHRIIIIKIIHIRIIIISNHDDQEDSPK